MPEEDLKAWGLKLNFPGIRKALRILQNSDFAPRQGVVDTAQDLTQHNHKIQHQTEWQGRMGTKSSQLRAPQINQKQQKADSSSLLSHILLDTPKPQNYQVVLPLSCF